MNAKPLKHTVILCFFLYNHNCSINKHDIPLILILTNYQIIALISYEISWLPICMTRTRVSAAVSVAADPSGAEERAGRAAAQGQNGTAQPDRRGGLHRRPGR